MCNSLFKHKLHQFLGRWTHILESLSERHNGKSHAFQVLNHLYCSPTVKGNLSDVESLTKTFYEIFDVSIVNNISFRSLKIAFSFPQIIGNMIPSYSKVKRIFRHPEIRKNYKFIILIKWRKHKHECRDIRCTG